MLDVSVAQLLQYSRAGEIPANVREAIGKAIQLKQGVLDVEQQMAARTQRINEITQEQNRLRENMKTVAPSTQYYERLLAKLNEQESTIESLQKDRDDRFQSASDLAVALKSATTPSARDPLPPRTASHDGSARYSPNCSQRSTTCLASGSAARKVPLCAASRTRTHLSPISVKPPAPDAS